MSLAVAISAIKFLFERYSDAKDKKLLSLHLLGTLNRELAFNSELSGEAEKIHIKTPYVAKQLIASMKTDAFDAISALGITLSNLFEDIDAAWSTSTSGYRRLEIGAYHSRLKNVKSKPVLIERSYHRLKIMIVYANLGVTKSGDSYQYLSALLIASRIATTAVNSIYPFNSSQQLASGNDRFNF